MDVPDMQSCTNLDLDTHLKHDKLAETSRECPTNKQMQGGRIRCRHINNLKLNR